MSITDKLPRIGDIMPFGGNIWRIIEVAEDSVLLLCQTVLEERLFHEAWVGVSWQNSDMRKYLNGSFLKRFSDAEARQIKETKVITTPNPFFDLHPDEESEDKVFLPGLDEIMRLFRVRGRRLNHMIDSSFMLNDRFNSSRMSTNSAGLYASWWLRTSGVSRFEVVFVDGYGRVSIMGGTAAKLICGIRPMIWLYR